MGLREPGVDAFERGPDHCLEGPEQGDQGGEFGGREVQVWGPGGGFPVEWARVLNLERLEEVCELLVDVEQAAEDCEERGEALRERFEG